ncbi:MAG: hypothetical protein OEX81_01530 [Candidatus Pacebacteria bacterium]|nr:hypothetical protein [Candidatus Paceibacterota bacterium]
MIQKTEPGDQNREMEQSQGVCALIEKGLRDLPDEQRTAIAEGNFAVFRDAVKDMINAAQLPDVYYFGGVTNEQGGFVSTQEAIADEDFNFQGEIFVSNDEGNKSQRFSIFKMVIDGNNYFYYTIDKPTGLKEMGAKILKRMGFSRNRQ